MFQDILYYPDLICLLFDILESQFVRNLILSLIFLFIIRNFLSLYMSIIGKKLLDTFPFMIILVLYKI